MMGGRAYLRTILACLGKRGVNLARKRVNAGLEPQQPVGHKGLVRAEDPQCLAHALELVGNAGELLAQAFVSVLLASRSSTRPS